jgi:hypothetical protein
MLFTTAAADAYNHFQATQEKKSVWLTNRSYGSFFA